MTIEVHGTPVDVSILSPAPPLELREQEDAFVRESLHVARMVAAASMWPLGAPRQSAVRCRRASERRRCRGRVTLLLCEVPNRLEWSCPLCGDQGWAINWRRSPWDLSGLTVDPESDDWLYLVEVTITEAEYRLLEALPLNEPGLQRAVLRAVPTSEGIVLEAPPRELTVLGGAIARTATTVRGEWKRRQLDRLHGKLQTAILQSA